MDILSFYLLHINLDLYISPTEKFSDLQRFLMLNLPA